MHIRMRKPYHLRGWIKNVSYPVRTIVRPNQGLTTPTNAAETERALKGMTSGKALGSDEIQAGT